MTKPRLLILSFSPIVSDARVLKQIEVFRDRYAVTTCGYGPAPAGVDRHIEMPRSASYQDLNGRLITLRMYRAAYWRISAVAWVKAHLRPGDFDVVFANETEAVPVGLWLKPRFGVHADLHEYTPRLNEEHALWAKRIRPFHEWVCRHYVTRAGSWSTVSNGLVREYEKEFGFRPELVTNAAPYTDAEPTPVSMPIRLVHSGACLRNRRLTEMVDAVALSGADVTLDLYLTPNHPDYLEELKARVADDPAITIHDPVPYSDLLRTLNAYDVGVHLLPPTNFNNAWALPNKLFDYVQARLGILIGPSPEMVEYVEEHGLGAVSAGFDAADLARTIADLDATRVAAWKANAHASARALGAQEQMQKWLRLVDGLVADGKRL
ncbi:glycosyltransferase family 1 protein [Agromyces sp. NPDC058064]|uniref:glycosyltransferase family 1 protein n=1 Tax=Agromyces sp. NPDC058064 TaxID=3346322 RepID=UPI0036DF9AAF